MSPVVGYATLQVIPSLRGVHENIRSELNGRDIGSQVGADMTDGIESGFDSDGLLSKLGGPMGAAGLALGATIGAAALQGISEAMGRQSAQGLTQAQLGLSEAEAARYGQVAGDVYASNFGDSFDGAREAVAAVGSSLGDSLGPGADALQRVSEQALTFANVFGSDVAEATTVAGTAIRTGLAEDATEAFDLMTAASQRMPAGIRSELLPAVEEYGIYLAELGFTGEEAFGLLASASEGGAVQLDKAGDALKEFQILSTDGSEATATAFQTIGLDAEAMADKIVLGGDTAKDAFDQTVAGLLAIEDPSEQARVALDLFGTPLEDISVSQVPQFLRGLQAGSDALGDFEGATDRAAEATAQGLAPKLESLRREVMTGLADVAEQYVIPALDETAGALEAVAGFATDNYEPIVILTGAWVGLKAASLAATGASVIAGLFAVGGALEGVTIRAAYAAQGIGQIATASTLAGAKVGVQNLSTAVGGLATTAVLANGLLLGVAAVGGTAWHIWNSEARKAEASLDDLYESLDFDPQSLDLYDIQEALSAMNAEVSAANEELQEYSGIVGALRVVGEMINPAEANNFAELANEIGVTTAEAERLYERWDILNEGARMAGLTWDEMTSWAQRLNLDPATQSSVDMAIAIDEARRMAETGSPVVDTLAGSFTTMGDETASATDQLNAFKDTFDALIGVQVSWEEAQIGFAESIFDLKDAAIEAAAAGEEWSTNLFDGSEAALETRSQVAGLVDEALNLATSFYEAGGGIDGATWKLAEARNQIIEAGKAAGISEADMISYLDTLGLTPENITTVIEAQANDGSVSAANQAIDYAARDRTSTIDVEWSIRGEGVPSYLLDIPNRHRGLLEGPIPGRPGQEVPVLAQAGEWILTAEQFRSLTSRPPSVAGLGAGSWAQSQIDGTWNWKPVGAILEDGSAVTVGAGTRWPTGTVNMSGSASSQGLSGGVKQFHGSSKGGDVHFHTRAATWADVAPQASRTIRRLGLNS